MQYAKIVDNKVVQIVASPKKLGGYIELPKNHQVLRGDDIRFFNNGQRVTWEQAVAGGLAEVGPNETLVWDHGWVAKADYTKAKYWKKENGQPVRFKIGEKPDETMTDIEPIDYEAVWEKDRWIIPEEVLERREKEEAQAELERLDRESIRAMREILIAMVKKEEPPKESVDVLVAKEEEATVKRDVVKEVP